MNVTWGVIEEVLDVLPPPGGEVVDDGDVVVLCQVRPVAGRELEHRRCECLCKVGADEPAPPVTTSDEASIVGLV